MDIYPILAAMRRNKVGAILIAVQMAVTLAILCNGLFLIQQRVAASHRPSGADEADVFTIENQWVGKPQDLESRTTNDVAALRTLPDVTDAYVTNSYPMSDSGSTEGWGSDDPGSRVPMTRSAIYLADDHGIPTLGLKVIAGRNFLPSEVAAVSGDDSRTEPRAIIITRALAEKLFPRGDALGRTMPGDFSHASTPIVGIVDRLQVPWVAASSWASKFNDNSSILPFNLIAQNSVYVVRARPGQLQSAMRSAERRLLEISRARVIGGVRSLPQTRAEAYRDDRGLAVILGVVCAALLTVTAFGIVGLTSYWVAQRRRQIGIRRALGATRQGIVRYFQTENLLIASAGAAVGIGLAVALNLWMVTSFELPRLNTAYALVGAAVVLLLGQLAVLWPALRAASIPPALATRAV